jgi:hypothetical protein
MLCARLALVLFAILVDSAVCFLLTDFAAGQPAGLTIDPATSPSQSVSFSDATYPLIFGASDYATNFWCNRNNAQFQVLLVLVRLAREASAVPPRALVLSRATRAFMH